MAAGKKLDKALEDKILIDWKTGEYSQRDLANKYQVSAGKIASLTKGVSKDLERIVSAGVEYYQGLQGKDVQTVSAVAQAVDRKARLKSRVQEFVDEAVEKGFDLLKSAQDGQEFKAIVEAIDKASITANINERHAKPSSITANAGIAVVETKTSEFLGALISKSREST